MTFVQVTTYIFFLVVLLLRVALLGGVVAAVVAIVRVLREPRDASHPQAHVMGR